MSFAIDDLEAVVGHWSADQITGLSDGDPVSALPASVGVDLTASGSARPLYRPTGLESQPSLEFDGVDDFLATATAMSVAAGPVGTCCVVELASLKSFQTFLALSTASGAPVYGAAAVSLFAMGYANGNLLVRSQTPLDIVNSALSASTTLLLTYSAGVRGFVGLVDGAAFIVGSSSGARPTLSGGNHYASFGDSSLSGAEFSGHLSEAVAFNETELCESLYVEGVLAHKYGVTLPTSHPFAAAAPTEAPGSGGGGSSPVTLLQSSAIPG